MPPVVIRAVTGSPGHHRIRRRGCCRLLMICRGGLTDDDADVTSSEQPASTRRRNSVNSRSDVPLDLAGYTTTFVTVAAL